MSEMVSLRTEGNGVKRTGTASGESASSSRLGILDPTSAGCHHATDQNKSKRKWEIKVNKVAIECWIINDPKTKKIGFF